jgi:hypothetical protein
MALSVNLLQTKADCDVVLADLNQSKDTLAFNRLRAERSKDTSAQRATGIEADLAANQAEVTSLTAVIASLPDGSIKTQLQGRLRKAAFNVTNLEERKAKSGTTAVILFESQIKEIDSRLSALNADIAEVEARKATL